jgi:opacity protein-like surface antigen
MKPALTLCLLALCGASLQAAGFGLGVQTAFDLDPGQAVAPRLDYQRSTDSTTAGSDAAPVNLSSTVDMVSLGADYQYYPGGRTGNGLYLQAGLGLAWARLDVSGSGPGGSGQATSRQTRPYPEAGLGYAFTSHFGLEVLYRALRFNDVTFMAGQVPVTYSLTAGLLAGVTVRF